MKLRKRSVVFLALLCHGLLCNVQASTFEVPTTDFLVTLQQKKKKGQKLSVTEALYLKVMLHRAKEIFADLYVKSELVREVGSIEAMMQEKGYITFVHGRKWQWHFVNDIWNLICAIRDNQATMSDRISMRYRDKNVNAKNLYAMRKDLIKSGVAEFVNSATDAKGKDAEVTFMSRTLVSHDDYTAEFFLDNDSFSADHAAYDLVVDLLKQYGLQQYTKQIKKLYELHQEASKYGEMLTISVHKDYLNELVYPSQWGGIKYETDKTCLEYIQASQERVDQDEQYLDDDDQEAMCYCFAVIDIPGEDQSKYKIQSIHHADSEKYKEYQDQLQSLFEGIKKQNKVAQDSQEADEIKNLIKKQGRVKKVATTVAKFLFS